MYADVVLPLNQPLYTYTVPEGLSLRRGQAVVVPLGRDKLYTGIVWRVHDVSPRAKTVKTIAQTQSFSIDEFQCLLWEWIAEYYMCTLGEVMRVALPAALKPSGEGAAEGYKPPRKSTGHGWNEPAEWDLPVLSQEQARALSEIRADGHAATLLRGVTGSGKTEIYMHLIAEVLEKGSRALLLVPEIALTGQLTARLKRVFGDRVVVYHSRLTPRQRAETYLRLQRGAGELVIGARSALFLPLVGLKQVIVDEEHDASYKQSSPAPRYQGRDMAIVLAHLHGARVVLGSATPSLESFLNAHTGKYGYVTLDERYGGAVLPQITLSDTLRAVKRGERHGHFNLRLLDALTRTLEGGGQAILFQNRRGFAPQLACAACGWVPQCPDCNVALTSHTGGRLVCHYCGYTAPAVETCPRCGGKELRPQGFGTEKIEQLIAARFPEAGVERLDRDKATSAAALRKITERFERGEARVLVGTQMVSKGFDFAGVELVGVLNADNLLFGPDFRTSERAFQLLMQVAGRAGRRQKQGQVVIQTADAANPVLQQLTQNSYEAVAKGLLAERAKYFYPPYAHVIALELRYRDGAKLREAARALGSQLRERFGARVLGPAPPPVDRIRGEWREQLLLKIEAGASMARAREVLTAAIAAWRTEHKGFILTVDVDPA